MRSEVAKYQPQLDVLIGFAEGIIDGTTLDASLDTSEMQQLLGVFEQPGYPALTNYYIRLTNNEDRTSLRGLVNSEGIIEDFLKKAEVQFRAAGRFRKIHSLILTSVPSHLDPPLEFLTEKVIPLESNLSDTQKKKLIKERLKALFKYIDKPPRWIQSPDWPIRDGKPLIFLGQIAIDAPELFHDTGAAYLFYDPDKREFETISQFN